MKPGATTRGDFNSERDILPPDSTATNAATASWPVNWQTSASSPRAASRPRFNRCGKPNCACHANPPKLHGPYWHWTAKVDGKTVNRRLTEREARHYQEWIANDRRVRVLLGQMRDITAKAAELIITEEAPS